MFDFSQSEEVKSNNSVFVSTGIHSFLVKKIYFQPIGTSVNNESKRDGSLIEFTKEQLRIELLCTETHAGKDSKSAITNIGILPPVTDNPEKAKKQLDRMFHIFANMATSDKKEGAKDYLKKINVSTMKELANKLNPLAGKSVRLKFIANQEGTYPQLPNYYAGFAECADVPFESSVLKYDAVKEGTKQKDASRIESKGIEVDPFAPVPVADVVEELPFDLF